ncbi:unnamed protein product [Orchesella dallaii]|uniref:C2H2-type domain-containing protein n=1 Tax=Orchesella dallaii TaxID=48710 RepID=A0ABP1RAZ5_9HEXA
MYLLFKVLPNIQNVRNEFTTGVPSCFTSILVQHWKTKLHKCNWCPAESSLVSYLKFHLINAHNELKLRKEECPTFEKIFSNGSKMNGHQLHVHTQLEKKKECIICKKWFKDTRQLLGHLMVHTREKPFPCPKCPWSFPTGNQRRVHLITKHDIGVRLRCPVCNKPTRSKAVLETHMRVHTNERPFRCSMCPKACKTAGNLKCHMGVHVPEKPFCCNVCEKRYSCPMAYRAHCERHTSKSNSLNYQCDECPLSFYLKYNLKWHVKFVHGKERRFPCNICGNNFQTQSDRNRHINTHLREISYKCKICGKVLYYFDNLKRHMKTQHSKSESECYPCSKCPLIQKTELDFSRHYLLDHVGSKDNLFKCLFCKCHSTSLSDLEEHYRKHTRERPYFCKKCPKAFGSSGYLRKHSRIIHKMTTINTL